MKSSIFALLIRAFCIIQLLSTCCAYSDKAVLGAKLQRHVLANSGKGTEKNERGDRLSEDMKKQMKKIDALEDIFIGLSGSTGGKRTGTKVDILMITSVRIHYFVNASYHAC